MHKTIVIDANILIRAVLGTKVSALLHRYVDDVYFYTVDEAFEDAKNYLPSIIRKRGGDDEAVEAALDNSAMGQDRALICFLISCTLCCTYENAKLHSSS